jgi:hypothetical protein
MEGPINPFLVNDFVAPSSSQAAAASQAASARAASGPASAPVAVPQPPVSQPGPPAYRMPAVAPSLPHSTVTGVETADFDDEEMGFGRNRRKKLVRWFTVVLVLLTAGVTWAVVSSQLRARDPAPEPATAPPAETTPPVLSAEGPTPPVSATPSSTRTTTSTTTAKLTGKLRPAPSGTGQTPVRTPGPGPGPKKPSDGSVELPTPGDDPGLPPPAPCQHSCCPAACPLTAQLLSRRLPPDSTAAVPPPAP